jgi:hypothetical protein
MTSAGLRLLEEARKLVAQAWCRGTEARDDADAQVNPWDERATSWSLLGAIVAVLEREAACDRELPLAQLAAALCAIARLIDSDSLVEWNDRPQQTQASVVAVLDRAVDGYDDSDALFFSLN